MTATTQCASQIRPRPRAESARRGAGFTLIEVMAVVILIGMVVGLGSSRLSSRWDPLADEAENIAQSLRFARQRAIMTGVPHRLLIDLEEGGYLVEWYVSEERAAGGSGGDPSGFADALSGGDFDEVEGPTIDLVPSRRSARDYYPIRHREMGTFRWLDDELYFVGVEGSTGWVEGGDYSIIFYTDGTTDAALLELANSSDQHLTLTIEPVLDRVHVRKGGARS